MGIEAEEEFQDKGIENLFNKIMADFQIKKKYGRPDMGDIQCQTYKTGYQRCGQITKQTGQRKNDEAAREKAHHI